MKSANLEVLLSMRVTTALVGAVLGIVCLPSAASAQLPVPSGLPFSVSKVPNLERDCGRKATTAPTQPADPNGVNPAAPNPLAADRFFVDPTERSYKDMQIYKARGQQDKAAAMANLAMQPKARWMGRFTRPGLQTKVRRYLNCVQVFQPGATPLIVVMRHQGIECNSRYTGGGVAEDKRTPQVVPLVRQGHRRQARGAGLRARRASAPSAAWQSRAARRAWTCSATASTCCPSCPNATMYLEATASDWKPAAWTAASAALPGASARCAASCST